MFSKTEKTDKQAGAPAPQPTQGQAQQPKPSAQPRTGNGAAPPSLISSNLQVVGNLKTDGEIQIDGVIDGDVACGKLMIGERATVNGEVVADNVEVRGTVEGRIRGKTVLLAKSARVTGDIWHDSLSIEAGAYLDGHCKRNDSATAAQPAAAASTPRPEAVSASNREAAQASKAAATAGH